MAESFWEIPTRFRFTGDTVKGRELLPFGKKRLWLLETSMGFQGIECGVNSIRLPGGEKIKARISYGLSTVEIYVPIRKIEHIAKPEKEKNTAHYFVWIKNTTSNHEAFKTNRLILWELPLASEDYTNSKGIDVKGGEYDADAGSIILDVDVEQGIVYTPDCNGEEEGEAIQIALAEKYLTIQLETKNLPENLFADWYNMGSMTSPDDTYNRYSELEDRPNTVKIYNFNEDDFDSTYESKYFELGLNQAFEDDLDPLKPRYTYMMEPYQYLHVTPICDDEISDFAFKELIPQQLIDLASPFVYLPYGGEYSSTPLVYTCLERYVADYGAVWDGISYPMIEANVWPGWSVNSIEYYGTFDQQILLPTGCFVPLYYTGYDVQRPEDGELVTYPRDIWGYNTNATSGTGVEDGLITVRSFNTGTFFTGTELSSFPTFIIGLSGYVLRGYFALGIGVWFGDYYEEPHPEAGCKLMAGQEEMPALSVYSNNTNVFNGSDQSLHTPFETIGLSDFTSSQGDDGVIETNTCFDSSDSATLYYENSDSIEVWDSMLFDLVPCEWPCKVLGYLIKSSATYTPDILSTHPQYVETDNYNLMSLSVFFERGVRAKTYHFDGVATFVWGNWPMTADDYLRIWYYDDPYEGEGYTSNSALVPNKAGSMVGVVFYVVQVENFFELDEDGNKINFFDPHTQHVKSIYGNENNISPHRLLDLEEHVMDILHDRKEQTYAFPDDEKYHDNAVYNLYKYGDEFKTGFVFAV